MNETALSDTQYQRLNDKINKFQSVQFGNPYWFSEKPDSEYCYNCATKKNDKNSSWQREGGFSIESDTFLFCAYCGVPLSHTLTDYGAEQELTYYEKNEIDLSNECVQHTIVCISSGFPISHQERLYKIIFGEG